MSQFSVWISMERRNLKEVTDSKNKEKTNL